MFEEKCMQSIQVTIRPLNQVLLYYAYTNLKNAVRVAIHWSAQ